MVPDIHRSDVQNAGPEPPDLEPLTGYEDGDYYVIRDEDEPNAWIRSDSVADLRN